MAKLDVVPLRAFDWDFRIEGAGTPPVTLELTRFRDRGTFTWSGSQYHLEGTGFLRRAYTLQRGGVIVARAESRGLLRRSYEVRIGERKVVLRRSGFLGMTMLVEQGRERLGEIRKVSVFRRTVSATIDDRLEGAGRLFLVFLALVEWRRDSRRHN